MTTIVAIENKNWAVMAADSQITEDNTKILSTRTPKIIKFKDMYIGLRGDARPGDIIAYNWKPPKIKGDIQKWVVGTMIPSMIKAFEKNNYDWEDDKADFSFLVMVKNEIFDIGSDMSISRSDNRMYAVGSGKDYAMGGLAVLGYPDDLENAIINCMNVLNVSKEFDINTGGFTQVVTYNK